MSILIDYGVSRRFVGFALALLAIIYIVRLTPHEMVTSVRRLIHLFVIPVLFCPMHLLTPPFPPTDCRHLRHEAKDDRRHHPWDV